MYSINRINIYEHQHQHLGSKDGAVVRALAFHQCGPGSIPGPGVICGLSLLLVLVLASRVFLWVLRFSSPHKNQHFQIPIALFTVNFSHLHYSLFEHGCEAISGGNCKIARNCLTSTFNYIVVQMRKVNSEKSYSTCL